MYVSNRSLLPHYISRDTVATDRELEAVNAAAQVAFFVALLQFSDPSFIFLTSRLQLPVFSSKFLCNNLELFCCNGVLSKSILKFFYSAILLSSILSLCLQYHFTQHWSARGMFKYVDLTSNWYDYDYAMQWNVGIRYTF